MPIILEHLIQSIRDEQWAKEGCLSEEFLRRLKAWLRDHVLLRFLNEVVQMVDEVVDIDPELSEPQILQHATQHMVDFLLAQAASVRIYDPQNEQMLSYGSYPPDEAQRETFIPLTGTIAGEVVTHRQPVLVPDIMAEGRYRNKTVVFRKNVRSLMAIPLEIPRFFPHERDTIGVIQIYYTEVKKEFAPLEVLMAELFAKRLSFVIARKKILLMHRTNEKKEMIVRHMFRHVGDRAGIKLKDVFDRVIPELVDVMQIQSCALFSVTPDGALVTLEAGFPESSGYHSIGKTFPLDTLPAFEVLMNLSEYDRQSRYEIVAPSHLAIVDLQHSELVSRDMRRFAELHNINSILYIPLIIGGRIEHIMTFDAIDQKQRYTADEIDILLFLGRELVKAQKMERLDDALHDFKNPAIATAGFARRLKKLLESGECANSLEQIQKYADILVKETSRIQELALSIYQPGQQETVDLSEILRQRFSINREVIYEQRRQEILLREGPYEPGLWVATYLLHLERVFDNLLNNATKAIPAKGGVLTARTYRDGADACAEISNTGYISEENRLRLLEGEGEGRGLYITHRIMRLLGGRISIEVGKGITTFAVRIPASEHPTDTPDGTPEAPEGVG